jgi:multiple sugar transport system substrate-binding protein
LVARYGKVWSVRTGARLEVVSFDARSMGPDQVPADGWLIPPPELARWAAAGRLLPVPPAYLAPESRYLWRDLLPVDRNKLLVWDRTVYALPFLSDALLCYYRDDWFRDSRNQGDFQATYARPLRAPTTWDEFADVAEFFRGRARAGEGPPAPSLPPLPDTDADLDREFFSVAAPLDRRALREDERSSPPDEELFSFHYDVQTGRPRLDRPAFVEALRFWQRLRSCRPQTAARQPAESFRSGQAVLCLAGAEWVARFQEEDSPVRGRFGLCPVPGSARVFDYRTGEPRPASGENWVPYLGSGGWIAVVPRRAAHPVVAFALFAELSGPKISAEIVLDPAWGGGVFRRDHFGLLTEGNPFALDSQGARALARSLQQTRAPAIVNPVLCLRTPGQREHRRALVEEVRSALLGSDTDPRQALAAVVRRWQQLDEAKTERERLAEYRASLGLPASR